MRFWLHVHGAEPQPGGWRLRREDIGPSDEIMCGACNALLTVDHVVWVNAGPGDAPGVTDSTLTCALCGTVGDTSWVTSTRPATAWVVASRAGRSIPKQVRPDREPSVSRPPSG